MITTILDFFLMTWVFWPIILTLPFVAYYNITTSAKKNESEFLAGFIIACIVGALTYHYPILRGYFDGWRAIATIIGGYIVVGFFLSLYKWLVVLWDFRRSDVATKVKGIKDWYNAEEKSNYSHDISYYISKDFPDCIVVESNGKFSVFPNWKKYPIGAWWVYWPFFLLELPFDFIKRVMENLFEWLKHFYNGIAKKFSISV